jgi:heterodisulfide reductase subunit A-like polyferredoxin
MAASAQKSLGDNETSNDNHTQTNSARLKGDVRAGHLAKNETSAKPVQNACQPLRIAVIGSGVSGLAALWSLKNTQHEVHLYEKQDYIGGHTQTVQWKNLHGKGTTSVDVAFTLFNRRTYRECSVTTTY